MEKSERLNFLRDLIQDEPDDPFANYALILEMAENEQDFGQKLWSGFLVRFPDYLPAYYISGMASSKAGDSEQAIAIWKRGLDLAIFQKDQHAQSELKSVILNEMIDD